MAKMKLSNPKVNARISGDTVPGSGSRARVMEAQGVQESGGAPSPIGAGKDMVMPVDHPAAQSTRTVKATQGFGP